MFALLVASIHMSEYALKMFEEITEWKLGMFLVWFPQQVFS